MKAYIFTVDQPNICIVSVGKDEVEGKAIAEVAVSGIPGAKLAGFKEIDHSVIFRMDVTILSKTPPDDVLMRRLSEHFKGRAELELRNDNLEDGTIKKKFFVNGKEKVYIHLNSREMVEDYMNKGFGDENLKALIDRLEAIVPKDIEFSIVEDVDEEKE